MENTVYTHDVLYEDLKKLKADFPNLSLFSIGKSYMGRELYAAKLGNGSYKVFFSAAYHGTEWLTAKVLFEFIKELCKNPNLVENTSVYAVFMVNPDGVDIASGGKNWQANANGVDINHNFDALWALSKQCESKYSADKKGATRFGGDYPESEPETRAIANFTRQNSFDTVIALHSQGEVIYYDFCGIVPDGTARLLDRFEAVSRYKRDIPDGIASYGGYKDWFIKKYKKPGFTIEIGLGENPLPLSDFDNVYKGVFPILREALKMEN